METVQAMEFSASAATAARDVALVNSVGGSVLLADIEARGILPLHEVHSDPTYGTSKASELHLSKTPSTTSANQVPPDKPFCRPLLHGGGGAMEPSPPSLEQAVSVSPWVPLGYIASSPSPSRTLNQTASGSPRPSRLALRPSAIQLPIRTEASRFESAVPACATDSAVGAAALGAAAAALAVAKAAHEPDAEARMEATSAAERAGVHMAADTGLDEELHIDAAW